MVLKANEPAKQAETKADVFKRLAGARLMKVLDAMDTLGNCANKHQYEYTDEQAAKIRRAIEDKLAFIMKEFERKKEDKQRVKSTRVFEL